MTKGISKLLLSEGYNKTDVAFRYYEKTSPGRYTTREAARKQFQQDTTLDTSVILDITTDIYKEQVEMIQTYVQVKLIGAQ